MSKNKEISKKMILIKYFSFALPAELFIQMNKDGFEPTTKRLLYFSCEYHI